MLTIEDGSVFCPDLLFPGDKKQETHERTGGNMEDDDDGQNIVSFSRIVSTHRTGGGAMVAARRVSMNTRRRCGWRG